MMIFYATKLGQLRHKEVIDLWLNHERSGTPNFVMVAFADQLLGFDRKLYDRYLEASEQGDDRLHKLYDETLSL